MARLRQNQVFLTREDEDELLAAIRRRDPSAALVDGQRWGSPEPPAAGSAATARSPDVYIWSKKAVPQLRSVPRADGSYQGPTSGVVVQLDRSIISGDTLRSGRLAVGYDDTDPAMTGFVDSVFEALREITSSKLRTLQGDRRPYRIGRMAMKWARVPGHRLRDRSVDLYFRIDD